ncbi:unnamed protein product [Sphenostylis stenocarpa]|uniref:Phosphorylated adapter RNA export protein n=1 Tax=Sphenostylis stenocarpa TaxID=92480 RepID=A0AA86TAQ9_9FABA|nr:unnamed protein product [Sphenostylis stenocarpa]
MGSGPGIKNEINVWALLSTPMFLSADESMLMEGPSYNLPYKKNLTPMKPTTTTLKNRDDEAHCTITNGVKEFHALRFSIIGAVECVDMENGENILDAIFEGESLDDVEMVDVEEGELVEQEQKQEQDDSRNVSGPNGVEAEYTEPHSKNRRRKNKRNRRKGSGTNGAVDINRFVIDTCRRLKEKKSYMVYTAVACLGVSALTDLISEVDAIQSCGGQKTVDGRRFRTRGGVLWSIIKVREPNAYKEIMKKAKEFEKQFRQPNVKQPPVQQKENSSLGEASTYGSIHQGNVSDKPFSALPKQDQPGSSGKEKRNSVHDRLRIPVSYDDDLLG